jgi:hypothetical protein
MGLRSAILPITTIANGTGSATATSDRGLFHSIRYVKTDFDNGIDFTVTVVNSATTDTILTATDVNASATFAPRMDRHTTAGAAKSADDVLIPFIGALKVTVAQGGNVKSGTFVLYWEELE